MANLKRYDVVEYDEETMNTCWEVESEDGEYVKFDDIKEYLPSASHNKAMFQLLCEELDLMVGPALEADKNKKHFHYRKLRAKIAQLKTIS